MNNFLIIKQSREVLIQSFQGFGVLESSANRIISEICVSYLLLFDKPDSLSTETFLDFPLLDYATEFWHIHAKVVPEDPQSLLANLCAVLFNNTTSSAFLNWLRAFDRDHPKGYET